MDGMETYCGAHRLLIPVKSRSYSLRAENGKLEQTTLTVLTADITKHLMKPSG